MDDRLADRGGGVVDLQALDRDIALGEAADRRLAARDTAQGVEAGDLTPAVARGSGAAMGEAEGGRFAEVGSLSREI